MSDRAPAPCGPGPDGPHCPACRATLVDVVRHRRLEIGDGGGSAAALGAVALYCSRCGSTLALWPDAGGPVSSTIQAVGHAAASPEDPTAVVVASVPEAVRVDLVHRAGRIAGCMSGTDVDVAVLDHQAEGVVGPEPFGVAWHLGTPGAGAGAFRRVDLQAELGVRSLEIGGEVGAEGGVLGVVDDLEPGLRVMRATGAAGDTFAVTGAVAGTDVDVTLGAGDGWSRWMVWGQVAGRPVALDVRPEPGGDGGARRCTGRYAGSPLLLLPTLCVLLGR